MTACGHHGLHLLRHHADIGLVAAVVAEAIEAEAVVEMAEHDDVVLQPDVGLVASATTATSTAARPMRAAAASVAPTAATPVRGERPMGPAAAGMTLPAAGAPRGEVPRREVLRTASVLVGPALMLAAALVRRAALVPPAGAVRMAAAMLQAVPALASAEADAAAEFGADDVPAGAAPAVVVPTVIVAIDREFFDVRRGGWRCRWRVGRSLDWRRGTRRRLAD